MIVTDVRKGPKTGKYIEKLGSYDPRNNERNFKADRVQHWIANGAQVSDTVHNLLVSEKIIEGKKKNVLPRKSPVVNEEAVAKEKEEAEKAAAAKEVEEKAPEESTPAVEEVPVVEEVPTEEAAPAPETPVEEAPAEEKKEEAPAEEAPAETPEA
jgi:small subunit ribosomal protein S16